MQPNMISISQFHRVCFLGELMAQKRCEQHSADSVSLSPAVSANKSIESRWRHNVISEVLPHFHSARTTSINTRTTSINSARTMCSCSALPSSLRLSASMASRTRSLSSPSATKHPNCATRMARVMSALPPSAVSARSRARSPRCAVSLASRSPQCALRLVAHEQRAPCHALALRFAQLRSRQSPQQAQHRLDELALRKEAEVVDLGAVDALRKKHKFQLSRRAPRRFGRQQRPYDPDGSRLRGVGVELEETPLIDTALYNPHT